MERNANYALVGLISTVLLIGMIVFILWLTNFALSQHYDKYSIVFNGPISGLSKGGEVMQAQQLYGAEDRERVQRAGDALFGRIVLTRCDERR